MSADSFDQADATLDDLGIPRLQESAPTTVVSIPQGVGEGGKSDTTLPEHRPPDQETDSDTSQSGAENETDTAKADGIPTRLGDASTGGKQGTTATGDSASATVPRSPERAPRPHLRSYMIYGDKDEDSGMSEKAKAHRRRIDDMGIARALSYEADRGRNPKKEDHFNKGFDIQSFDQQGNRVRIIEVKAIGGKWDGFGVGMTDAQFQCALDNKAEYWLYVVEDLDGDDPKVHAIPDPVNKAAEYRFDELWREAAHKEPTVRRRSPLSAKLE